MIAKKKNRIYISIPFGCDNNERVELVKAKYAKNGVVFVPSDFVRDNSLPMHMAISKRIEGLLDCDMSVFVNGWPDARECMLEYEACRIFGIEIITDGKL